MYKKLTHLIAAVSLLGASSCCSVIQPVEYDGQRKNQIVFGGNHKANSLDEMVDTSYCLRVRAKYGLDGMDIEKGYLGSGFGYRKAGEYYYLVTNKHVLGKKKHRFGPLVFQRQDISTKIIDNKFDQDPSDDIKLELVYEDPIKDLAVLRTKQKINILADSYFGDSDSLKYCRE